MTSIKKLPHSEVEINASIPAEEWEKRRAEAVKTLNETVSIDGFRKGNVPESVLVAKVGEMAVLEEMAELAISGAYVDILMTEKIDAIGRPRVRLTKLAKGNPLEFTAVTAVVPEVSLPDYKKLAGKEVAAFSLRDETKVTDKDTEYTARDKLRIKIADAITDASTVDIPEIMIGSELDRTQARFEADIERMGVKLDDYLKHAKKTLPEIREEWRTHAEKKAKLQLILNAIAKAENIAPTKEEIDAEAARIIEHYKGADRSHASVYAETVLTNDKAFRLLEKRAE